MDTPVRLTTIDGVQQRLDALLRQAGCHTYSANEVRAEAGECWREIREDAAAHGGSPDDPFFNFLATDGAAVVTIFEPTVSIYVVAGEEFDLIQRIEGSGLALIDVEPARRFLAREFGKVSPDLTIDASLAAEWLAGSPAGD